MLEPIGMFHTPKSWDELLEWINAHNASDRAHIMVAACMAFNLAAHLTQESTDGKSN